MVSVFWLSFKVLLKVVDIDPLTPKRLLRGHKIGKSTCKYLYNYVDKVTMIAK